MRTLALCVLAVLLAGSTAAVASPDTTRSPTLRLLDRQPLVLRGTSFRSSERVTVKVSTAGQLRSKVVRATAIGRFTATFVAVELDRCAGGATILATGARGSQARLKIVPLACPPP